MVRDSCVKNPLGEKTLHNRKDCSKRLKRISQSRAMRVGGIQRFWVWKCFKCGSRVTRGANSLAMRKRRFQCPHSSLSPATEIEKSATLDALCAVGATLGNAIPMGSYAEEFLRCITSETRGDSPILRALIVSTGRTDVAWRSVCSVHKLATTDSKTDIVISPSVLDGAPIGASAPINVQVKMVSLRKLPPNITEASRSDAWVRVHTSPLETLMASHATLPRGVQILNAILHRQHVSVEEYAEAYVDGLQAVRMARDEIFVTSLLGHGTDPVIPDVHAFMAFSPRNKRHAFIAPRFCAMATVNSRYWVEKLKAHNGGRVHLTSPAEGIPTLWIGGLKIQGSTSGRVSVYATTGILDSTEISLTRDVQFSPPPEIY